MTASLARPLRQAGHKVYGLIHDEDKPRAKALEKYEVQLALGDVKEPKTYQHLIEQSDAIIHAMMDFESPEETDRTLFATFQDASDAQPRNRLFIYTTGCSIYGKRPERIMDERTPANPEHVLAFRMGLEKELFDMIIDRCRRVVLRPGFMYGLDGKSSVTSMWFQMGEKGKATYRGDRQKGWSWVHVADLAQAYVRVVENSAVLDKEVFCIAEEQRPKCLDIAKACMKAAGYDGEIEFAEPDEKDKTSVWFNQNEFITSHKARKQLGWVPNHIGVIDEVDVYYAAWKAANASS